jgi:hypothetical protein
MEPLGFRMASGEAVMRRLITGQSWKKWVVLPVPAMMLGGSVVLGRVVGGPTGVTSNGGSAKGQVRVANDEL